MSWMVAFILYLLGMVFARVCNIFFIKDTGSEYNRLAELMICFFWPFFALWVIRRKPQ